MDIMCMSRNSDRSGIFRFFIFDGMSAYVFLAKRGQFFKGSFIWAHRGFNTFFLTRLLLTWQPPGPYVVLTLSGWGHVRNGLVRNWSKSCSETPVISFGDFIKIMKSKYIIPQNLQKSTGIKDFNGLNWSKVKVWILGN